MLRAEPGVYYEDLYPLVCVLPRYAYDTDVLKPNDLLPMWQASLAGRRSEWKPPTLKKSATTLSVNISLDEIEKQGWHSTSRFKTGFDPEKVLPTVLSDVPLRPSRNPPSHGFFSYFPIFRPLKRLGKVLSRRREAHDDDGDYELDTAERKRKNREPCDSNVPLEIVMYLNSYNAFLLRNSFLPPAAATSLTNTLSSLHDVISGLDRIRTTPLPFAYQAHLRMSLW
jgi:putative membrane protein